MLQVPELEIPLSNPFANDFLNREGAILKLTSLITKVEEPLTLAVNARWGSGKSTFIKMWQLYLQRENVHAININSWITDYSQDPLIPILDELVKYLKSQKTWKGDQQLLDDLWSSAKTYVKHGVAFGVKAATIGAFEGDELVNAAAEAAGNMVGDAFDSYAQATEAVKKISTTMQRLVADKDQNIVVFIDELDRCRPSYAIELLERVKHLFQTKGVVFVLSLDKEQLAHSVKAVYGHKFDSQNYLDRFFDVTFDLPEPKYEAYVDYLKTVSFFEDGNQKQLFCYLANKFPVPLRQLNRLIYKLNLAKTFIDEKDGKEIELAIILFLFVKQALPEEYLRFFSDSRHGAGNLLKSLSIKSAGDNIVEILITAIVLRVWDRVSTPSDNGTVLFNSLKRSSDRFDSNGSHKIGSIGWFAEMVMRDFQNLQLNQSGQPIKDRLYGLIEFTESLSK